MMPRNPGLNDILSRAKRQEDVYEWISAAESYKRGSAISQESGDLLRTAELYEKTGLCYRLAAMQADTSNSFVKRLRLAAEAYGNAASAYEGIGGKEARVCQCLAMVSYASFWLASSPDERRKALEAFNTLQTRVSEFLGKAGDLIGSGKAYNELVMCLCESDSDRCTLEWDYSKRENLIRETLRLGEKAIATFSEMQDDNEVAKAYCVTGKLYETARHVCESEESKKEFGQKGWNYLQKAVELCSKIGNPRLGCLASIWYGISTADWAGNLEDSLKCFEDSMHIAQKLRDNYLKGHAAHCLAYSFHWKCTLEQDPDRRKELFRKAIAYEEDALQCFRIFSFVPVSFGILPDSYSSLAQEETDPQRRHLLLEKAVHEGQKILTYAERSGQFPRPDWGVYHGLSKALYYLATIETNMDKKKQLLEKSLKHREESVNITEKAEPFDYWNRGVFRNYLALLNSELANIEGDESKKRELLGKAVENMESSLGACSKRIRLSPKASLYVTIGKYQDNYARILKQLHSLTGDADCLRKAIRVHEDAVEAYSKAGWPGRVAEAQWQIAMNYDKLGDYLTAAKSFESASERYRTAADKIIPLQGFYLDHVLYMQAWKEIEEGRHYHGVEDYALSKARYQKASDLCKSSKSWRYLAPNYSAWAQLENGEDLSRKERNNEAINAFKEAARLFIEARKSLEEAIPEIQSIAEKDKANELGKASETRREYCLGRILLEEGRIYNREGDSWQSAEKYGLAARAFQRIIEAQATDSEREELLPTVYSCQAWEKMKLGERKVSPELFSQSSVLFLKAKEHSSTEKTSLLALGNSTFCKALEAGTQFGVTGDLAFYSTAKQNMESSANYYLKAGFEGASAWVNANEALLDAYMHLSSAEAEIAHGKKLQLFQFAEKYLERSVHLYEKAGYGGKRGEVLKILAMVREKREFALSLSQALMAPAIASSTNVISVPSPTHEEPLGLEKFEHANIQAHLAAPDDVTVGEVFEVRLDLANVANEPGLLVRIENMAPSNLRITGAVPNYRWDDGNVDLKGKRLDPHRLESIRILATTSEGGIAHLSPRIIYVDELGRFKACQPEPAAITIYPSGKFEFNANNAQRVFEYLTKSFVEDYMRKRLTLDKSGWRTFMQIVKNAGVSKCSVYGTHAHRGTGLSELEGRGVVELRIFTEERGRGGKITRARIAYEKDIIKRYIDQQVMKIREK